MKILSTLEIDKACYKFCWSGWRIYTKYWCYLKAKKFSCYLADIILGNECWLNTDIASGEIFPDHYDVFRKDRPDGYGGVFQATKKDLIITQRSDFDTDCEIILTQWQLANRKAKSILFGSFYRPNVYDIKSVFFWQILVCTGRQITSA